MFIKVDKNPTPKKPISVLICVITYTPDFAVFGDVPIYIGMKAKNNEIQMCYSPYSGTLPLSQIVALSSYSKNTRIMYITLMTLSGCQADY